MAAGFDWIMHGNIMTDETMERLAASGIPLVPTLLLLANLADYGGSWSGRPAPFRDGCRRMLDKTADDAAPRPCGGRDVRARNRRGIRGHALR